MESALTKRHTRMPMTHSAACDLRLYHPETRSIELSNQSSILFFCSSASLVPLSSDCRSAATSDGGPSDFAAGWPAGGLTEFVRSNLFVSAQCSTARANVLEGM